MPRHERWRRTRGIIVDYALIGLGAALVGAAADLFFVPNRLVSGGLVGIATILYHTLGLPVGLTTLVMNARC